MNLSTAFRISTYACLTISTVCLGYIEQGGIPGFYVGIALFIVLAFFIEGRWVLSHFAANLVAVFIFLGWIGWFALSLNSRPSNDAVSVDLLRWMLPRAGPLLGLLLLAKLLREKNAGDYWLMHLLGLIQIALSCVLALSNRLDREAPFLALMLLAYAVTLVWSLTTFYPQRESLSSNLQGRPRQRTISAQPLIRRRLLTGIRIPWRMLGFAASLGWFLLAGCLALLIFFAIPRPGQDGITALFMPSGASIQTGFAPEIDLNMTGSVETSDEVAVYVEVFDSRNQKVALPGEFRFRGVVCTDYQRGRWAIATGFEQPPVQSSPIDRLGPGQYRLRLTLKDLAKLQLAPNSEEYQSSLDLIRSQPLFLAEPIVRDGSGYPIVALKSNPVGAMQRGPVRGPFQFKIRDLTLSASAARRTTQLVYEQLFATGNLHAREWQETVVRTQQGDNYDQRLRALPANMREDNPNWVKIAAVAAEVLKRKAIPPGARVADKAHALEQYLASSGEFTYSLERIRVDTALDPTVDFLCNHKQGHCELFASALALMLRSQGIPSRVVIGFRGAEWNSAGDYYEVKQYHAHAWVEALDQPIPGDARTWLILDPTPGEGTAGLVASQEAKSAFQDELQFARFLWELFILDYSGDLQRERLMARLREVSSFARFLGADDDLNDGWSIRSILMASAAVAAAAAVVLLLVRSWRRRSRSTARRTNAVLFYARLLRLLEKLGLVPQSTQTAREFGLEAALALRRRPGLAAVADVPLRVAASFYQVRFGGRELDAGEREQVQADLNQLQAAVEAHPRPERS